jgi:hypothetical protein
MFIEFVMNFFEVFTVENLIDFIKSNLYKFL